MMLDQPVLECPHCKKQGYVRLHSESDIFECVYCHYKDDLSKHFTPIPFDGGIIWAALLAMLVVLALLG